jgi:multiple sugar transport system substrate-binding protein
LHDFVCLDYLLLYNVKHIEAEGVMREIEFSSMLDLGPSLGMGDIFFNAFAAQQQIKVKRLYIGWPEAWNRLVQIGLSSHGPDLSEVGSTWLGSFHALEALRPLAYGEIISVGGTQRFPPQTWQACQVSQNNLVVGIPWTLDIRVVLYRRDWLQKAGVDESTAFADSGQLFETLKRVKAAGHPSPLGITTNHTDIRIFHDLASWVWSAGGDIRNENGRSMLLREANSRAGMEAYFGLHEFITPEMHGLVEPEVIKAFLDGKTAIAVITERTYYRVIKDKTAVELAENVGMAKLMQAPFVGGTALAIWRHSPAAQEALKLIQLLTSKETGQILYDQYLTTPANLEALEYTSLAADPFYTVITKSLEQGRSVHSGYRWGGVEARLVAVIEQMWNDLRANPDLNIAREVEQRFTELCDRLEQTILAWYG